MNFLHPVFTILFVFLIIYSFIEVNGNDERGPKAILFAVGAYMIIIVGLRNFVGADYPIYRGMYAEFFPTIDYSQLLDKMLFRKTDLDIEWMYVFLNKMVYSTGLPFQIFTLVSAIITISLKLFSYYKNSAFPVFSILLFMIPAYFIADSGHMRQALGMVFCLISFKFIKERKVWWYLLCLYIAFGFHKSSVVFLPAYWLAVIPMNSTKIFYAIIACVILSPFQVYNLFSGFLNSLNVQDVSNGFNGYINFEAKSSSFMDGLMLVYAYMLIAFDKSACEKVYYYEYMRNIMVFGVCLYFIMRDNPVFSTRLVGGYMSFAPLVIPNIIYSMNSNATKRMLHLFFVVFMIFYYFVFVRYQGVAGRFTPETYQNFLWNN
ncbi:EpsG family protein [Epilithonimonas sp.]|uniref:EpsG family protein n=1 Tax=Epilithonimonas sp. TaxID=2894511 RepID=UPI0028A0DDB6|nr:EpsG family protein [Epilithonimonas sp.]